MRQSLRTASALGLLLLAGRSASADSLVVSTGFNDAFGLNADAAPNSPYKLGSTIVDTNSPEPGWTGKWFVNQAGSGSNPELAIVQADTAYEGDGGLAITGASGGTYIHRSFVPQTGRFLLSQYLNLQAANEQFGSRPANSNVGNPNGIGPGWVTANGTFNVGAGLGDGGVNTVNTGIAVVPGLWYRVDLVVDVPSATWEFFVNGQQFIPASPLHFRGSPTSISNIDYITGVSAWVDNLTITQQNPADLNHDQAVDAADLLILQQNYQSSHGTFETGDLSGNGTVDSADLQLFAANDPQGLTPAQLAVLSPSFRSTVELAFKTTTWTHNGGGTWNTVGNWSSNVPNAAGMTALFLDAVTPPNAPAVVQFTASTKVGRIFFDSTSSYEITQAGAATLTLDNLKRPAEIHVLSGSHTLALPLVAAADLQVSVETGGLLKSTRGLSGTLSGRITKTGTGTWEATGGIALQPTGSLVVDAGTLRADSIRGGSLSIHAGATALLQQSAARSVSTLSGLTIDAGGVLDLSDNSLVIYYTGASPEPQIIEYVRNWANAKAGQPMLMTSVGGDSGLSQSGRSLAVFDNHDAHFTRFGGLTLAKDWNQVLVKYTYLGDANADGRVDPTDYAIVDGLQGLGHSWITGDLNFDGETTPDDYAQIDGNQGAGYGEAGGPRLSVAVVPEPIALVFLLPLALCRRSRRAAQFEQR